MNTVTVIDRVSNIERTITISSTEPIPTILKYIRDNEVDDKKLCSETTETEYRLLEECEFIKKGDEYWNDIEKGWYEIDLRGGKKEGISDENVGYYVKKYSPDEVKYRRKV